MSGHLGLLKSYLIGIVVLIFLPKHNMAGLYPFVNGVVLLSQFARIVAL